jgi:hypothetical protein
MTGGKLISSGYNLEEIPYLPAHLQVTSLDAEQNGNSTSVAAFEFGTILFVKRNFEYCIMNPVGSISFYNRLSKKIVYVAHVRTGLA